jgi:hypothetical protein
MRPTDKEIEEEFYTMPLESARGEVEMQQWAEENAARLKQQEAAKWARDFDPWHYIEDGDLPELTVEGRDLSEKFSDFLFIIPKGRAYHNALTAFYVKDDLENRIFFEGMKNRFDIDQVECWMHIPTPKK